MFYSYNLLSTHSDGKFAMVWVAATRGIRGLKQQDVLQINVEKLSEELIKMIVTNSRRPTERLSLRLSSQLIYGLILTHIKKVDLLLKDIILFICTIRRPLEESRIAIDDEERRPLVKKKYKPRVKVSTRYSLQVQEVPEITDLNLDMRAITMQDVQLSVGVDFPGFYEAFIDSAPTTIRSALEPPIQSIVPSTLETPEQIIPVSETYFPPEEIVPSDARRPEILHLPGEIQEEIRPVEVAQVIEQQPPIPRTRRQIKPRHLLRLFDPARRRAVINHPRSNVVEISDEPIRAPKTAYIDFSELIPPIDVTKRSTISQQRMAGYQTGSTPNTLSIEQRIPFETFETPAVEIPIETSYLLPRPVVDTSGGITVPRPAIVGLTLKEQRDIDILKKIMNYNFDLKKLTIEDVCLQPMNRLNISLTFERLLDLSKREYVNLHHEENSLELSYITRGARFTY